MTNWTGKRVLILGAARQGLALARWLARHGARVTLNDLRPLDDMRAAQASLADVDVEWMLGGHPVELLDRVDVLCPSGGVPLTLPIVSEAIQRGIPFSNDTQIFIEAAPCKTVGISGSAGKTTTTTLVGEMAKRKFKDEGGRMNDENATAHPAVFIGGNIGDPLINYVDDMTANDLAILEISSFQLDQMTVSTDIAAILNITPNHLDRHGTMDAYIAAKARLLDFQKADGISILGRDDPVSWNLRDKVKEKLLTFSLNELEEGLDGSYLRAGSLNLRDGKSNVTLMPREKIHLRGNYNVANVLAAFVIGHAAGFPLDAMIEAVEDFHGVPHRLELVREWNGVRWYNNSIASAPERTIVVLGAFEEPIVLLLGGRDKNLPWEGLMQLVGERVDHLVLFGEAAEKIEKTVASLPVGMKRAPTTRVNGLHEAVLRAAEVAKPGNVVLLSPGGTSFDEFKDFAERGERFKSWVQELP
ncbi:MAG: UDP-N-acetylmuramoylalanine--D-glutamate ligase [Anaerolineales bacterium]|nr:UDP-N-acetylmuramoylalanine--D-glutamate ligase [Anaerolineales bacterium]